LQFGPSFCETFCEDLILQIKEYFEKIEKKKILIKGNVMFFT